MTNICINPFSSVVIGNESLLIQCCELLLQRGHNIRAVVSAKGDIVKWAHSQNLTVINPDEGIARQLQNHSFDWLFSIANLSIIPDEVLTQATLGAVNFHDGPLPEYSGLNAPVWALINQEKKHGISWHLIDNDIDKGDVIARHVFDISDDETALTLNAKCFEAALNSFPDLLTKMENQNLSCMPQDLEKRKYYGLHDRPAAASLLDFTRSANELLALGRALDHGPYQNPISCPKIIFQGQVFLIGEVTEAHTDVHTDAVAGAILSVTADTVIVATQTTPVRLHYISNTDGKPLVIGEVFSETDVIKPIESQFANDITEMMRGLIKSEPFWRERLIDIIPAELPHIGNQQNDTGLAQQSLNLPASLTNDEMLAIVAAWVARICDISSFDLAFRDANALQGLNPQFCTDWVPVRFDATDCLSSQEASTRFVNTLNTARTHRGFARDLWLRDPNINPRITPTVGIVIDNGLPPILGTSLTVGISTDAAYLQYDTSQFSKETIARFATQIERLCEKQTDGDLNDISVSHLPILSPEEYDEAVYRWNNTQEEYDQSICIHHMFEAQVARTPDAQAVVFENTTMTYAELNAQANRVAGTLRDMGVGPDTLVGLFTHRSLDLVVGALAIQKAGGAYVPLDPTYPQNRITHFITDSGAPVIITQSDLVDKLPECSANLLVLDTDKRIKSASDRNIDCGVTSENLAYIIYTSGSTGAPKGVMVQHNNVANLFKGMDARINSDPSDIWLAVTSLSFDISVLELFYTLARGSKVVVYAENNRIVHQVEQVTIDKQKMDFSLFNWGNDAVKGDNKYKLLLEGAKFADKNGFCAVWTPERHFHSFGGLYPNPSVTGAAVAAVTENISIRAGSIVAPLHHPIRIAEEWAVIDNLTNGRTGLAIASGWQPDDFVLRPENTPPNNKPAMFDAIDTIRKLWAGEPVQFPTKSGAPLDIVTQPRPISTELPIWVTTAGNPQTWVEAGNIGANVLTHLLGQTAQEVKEKIALYHDALRSAGHDPKDFTVTLMLHTLIGSDRQQVREMACEPMKDYLRSAAGLIKQYAWAFPAFKKPKGVDNAFDLDLESINPDDMEAILDFAFERYFEEAGLFGTIEECLKRVEELKQIGVDEIACLVDYGLPVDNVLAGLVPLAELVKRANTPTEIADNDYSMGAQIIRHKVTHLQCTPSMMRMICEDEKSRKSLQHIKQLMIGGEAMPGSLIDQLALITDAQITNMYGPTEATIWSSSEKAEPTDGLVNVGYPISNTQLYVLDAAQQPVATGIPGELYIGGEGVTRGYWKRPDLTEERFLPNPFIKQTRMYRTGDLVCRRKDGKLDFMGRVDSQVKLRGCRIELGEIEGCLETHDDIQQAVVVTKEFGHDDIRLVAYFLSTKNVSNTHLRKILNSNLPSYMVPSHFVNLDEMPLTPNKKVDRNALPIPLNPNAIKAVAGFKAPQSSTEQNIAAIWTRILGVEKISSTDSFFDLGGHSLLVIQAHTEINAELGANVISITDIFRFPTLAALSDVVDTKIKPATSSNTISSDEFKQRAEIRLDAMAKRKAMRARRSKVAI